MADPVTDHDSQAEGYRVIVFLHGGPRWTMTTPSNALIIKAPEPVYVAALDAGVDVWLPGTRNERGHVSCIQGCCDLCCPEPWYGDLMEGDALDNEVMVFFLGDRLDRGMFYYGVPHNPLRRRRGPGDMSLELMDCRKCGMTTAKGFPCENHG